MHPVATYLPACWDSAASAAAPNGAALYRTSFAPRPRQSRLRGRSMRSGSARSRRLRSADGELMHHTGFSGTYPEFLQFLAPTTHSSHLCGIARRWLPHHREEDRPRPARRFGRLRRLPYGAQPVPAFRAKSSTTVILHARRNPRTVRPGMFFANTFEIHSRPRRRWKPSPSTKRSRATTSRSRSPRSLTTSPISGLHRTNGVRRRLGLGRREPGRGVRVSIRTRIRFTGKFTYDSCSICLVVDTEIMPSVGLGRRHLLLSRECRQSPDTHRGGGRPLHRSAGPGARLQGRATRSASPPRPSGRSASGSMCGGSTIAFSRKVPFLWGCSSRA